MRNPYLTADRDFLIKQKSYFLYSLQTMTTFSIFYHSFRIVRILYYRYVDGNLFSCKTVLDFCTTSSCLPNTRQNGKIILLNNVAIYVTNYFRTKCLLHNNIRSWVNNCTTSGYNSHQSFKRPLLFLRP